VGDHDVDHAGKVHTRGILSDAAQELPKNRVTPEYRYTKLVQMVHRSSNDTLSSALVTQC
jgi:hypothetical protein